MMDDALFVERVFKLDDGPLPVRFYAPVEALHGEHRCRYLIMWPDREVSRSSAGVDGVQALMLAMRMAHSELAASDAYRAGRLTWCDQGDLDLPPNWGVGPLYDVPRRPDGETSRGETV